MSISLDQDNSIKNNSMSYGNSLSGSSSTISFSTISFSTVPIQETKLYLDMDGVLTDFSSACEKLGKNKMFWFSNDKESFWKHVTSVGPDFWSKMPWTAEGRELYEFFESSGFCPTIRSTLPGPERGRALADARKGKIKWLSNELENNMQKMQFCVSGLKKPYNQYLKSID